MNKEVKELKTRKAIMITESVFQEALKLAKEQIGSENFSGYVTYLINKEIKESKSK